MPDKPRILAWAPCLQTRALARGFRHTSWQGCLLPIFFWVSFLTCYHHNERIVLVDSQSIIFFNRSRNCIGRNFALMEMRLILSSFVYHFNFEPVQESVEDAKDLRQFITYTIASNSYKVKISNREWCAWWIIMYCIFYYIFYYCISR